MWLRHWRSRNSCMFWIVIIKITWPSVLPWKHTKHTRYVWPLRVWMWDSKIRYLLRWRYAMFCSIRTYRAVMCCDAPSYITVWSGWLWESQWRGQGSPSAQESNVLWTRFGSQSRHQKMDRSNWYVHIPYFVHVLEVIWFDAVWCAVMWLWCTDETANLVLTVPGGGDGPGGVIVCAENYLIYRAGEPSPGTLISACVCVCVYPYMYVSMCVCLWANVYVWTFP